MSQNKLTTMDAGTLFTTPLAPTKFIASKLIPQRLHILAGAPKIGNSWLTLQISLRVPSRETLWSFPVTSGTVLYLCLEDSFTRIQTRLFDIADEAPENLRFATMSEVIGEGLENQIEDFLKTHSDSVTNDPQLSDEIIIHLSDVMESLLSFPLSKLQSMSMLMRD